MDRSRILLVVLTVTACAVFPAGATAAYTVGEAAPAVAVGSCSGCERFQDTSTGNDYAMPISGVIVSFGLRTGTVIGATNSLRLRTYRALPAAQWLVSAEGDEVTLPQQFDSVVTFPSRIPVVAGDVLGFRANFNGNTGFTAAAAPGNSYFPVPGSPAAGDAFAPITGPVPGRLNITARLEPDADADGFGDETQDLCTTDASRQTPCPIFDIAAPVVTQFKTAYKRFRVKPKGLAISKRAHPGTTISLNLSEPARVTFTVDKLFRGKITKGVCKKAGRSNRKNRRCTKRIVVHSFTRDLTTGPNSFPYSARYYDVKGKIGTLRPGPFRMTAVPMDYSGNTGVAETLAFKIRR